MSAFPLNKPCDMCGSPEGVLTKVYTNDSEYHCKTCAHRHALYTAAYDHLELLMREAVKTWLPMWGDLPGVVDLGEQLGQIGNILQREFKAGEFDQEDVQPIQDHLNAAD